jgi:hypothetical protein
MEVLDLRYVNSTMEIRSHVRYGITTQAAQLLRQVE